jgi:hypothetical protein
MFVSHRRGQERVPAQPMETLVLAKIEALLRSPQRLQYAVAVAMQTTGASGRACKPTGPSWFPALQKSGQTDLRTVCGRRNDEREISESLNGRGVAGEYAAEAFLRTEPLGVSHLG